MAHIFLRAGALLSLFHVLLLTSMRAANARTIKKPLLVSKFRQQWFKDFTDHTPSLKEVSKKNTEVRVDAKDHFNSVLPTNVKTTDRDSRALTHTPIPDADGTQKSYSRECNGTKFGLNTRTGDVMKRYKFYKRRYEGCEIVNGNLELVFLHDPRINYDMSFLKDIREITGYVLIVVVFAKIIPLTSLEIIRGETLYNGNSMFVALNYSPPTQNIVGLWELQMPSLVEITQGDVVFRSNNYMCFLDTIVWGTIMKQPDSRLFRRRNRVGIVRACGSCAYNCHDHCWGEGDDMCQADPDYYYY